MTDEQIGTTSRTFSSGPYTIDVAITCRAGHQPAYKFAAFQNGSAASFKWSTSQGYRWINWRSEYQVRLDGAAPQNLASREHRYSNVITMGGDAEDIQSDQIAHDAIKARRVVFALQLDTGDATIDIDQSPGDISPFLERCVGMSQPRINLHPETEEPAVGPTIKSDASPNVSTTDNTSVANSDSVGN